MYLRYFALAYGAVFLLVGILGFIPGITVMTDMAAGESAVALDGGYGLLLGLFPVNWLHNLVHIAFGVWGLAVSRSVVQARTYARAVAVIYAVLAVMGLIPVLATVFGLVPLFGNDIWLHALLAIGAAVFGWGPLERKSVQHATPQPRAASSRH